VWRKQDEKQESERKSDGNFEIRKLRMPARLTIVRAGNHVTIQNPNKDSEVEAVTTDRHQILPSGRYGSPASPINIRITSSFSSLFPLARGDLDDEDIS
jgi:hypothetical protein